MRFSAVLPQLLSPSLPVAPAYAGGPMASAPAHEIPAREPSPAQGWQAEPAEFDLAQRVRESGEW